MEKLNDAKISNVQTEQAIEQEEMFLIVSKEGKYFIALGNKIVSKQLFETIEEARTYISSKPWELIMNVAGVICEYQQKPEELDVKQ